VYFVENEIHREYKVDPKHLVIAGDSAGGALSAIFAQRAKNHVLLKNTIKVGVILPENVLLDKISTAPSTYISVHAIC